MSDEELADVMCRTYDLAKSMAWVNGLDDDPNTRHDPRVRERWLSVVRATRDRVEASKREQTAATILAALLQDREYSEYTAAEMADEAVTFADTLRARLARRP